MLTLQKIIATMFFAVALAGTSIALAGAGSTESAAVRLRAAGRSRTPRSGQMDPGGQRCGQPALRPPRRRVKAGQVIFAGKTTEPLDTTFGLVVFEAESEAAARQFMESDPAVVAGVMSATLHPYALALQRKP